jgi:glycosyltransferase involved in cell wall biosynthesis
VTFYMTDTIKHQARPPGVSVVICTHNGASRIGPCLAALAAQRETHAIGWEILIVDNRSSDNLAEVVQRFQEASPGLQFRLVSEGTSGTAFARQRGIAEALYEFISFVDDDNDVEDLWVRKVYALMLAHPEIGACGGVNVPSYEMEPPYWCRSITGGLAIGPQSKSPGRMDSRCGTLWTSGMTLRWSAWRAVLARGFHPHVAGRIGGARGGSALMPGEDSEMSHALSMCGWTLWSDHDLKQIHRIPAARLQWDYFRRLYFGFGMSYVPLSPYRRLLKGQSPLKTDFWIMEIVRLTFALARRENWYGWYCLLRSKEGSYSVLRVEKLLGMISMLSRLRSGYGRICAQVRQFSLSTP